MKKEKALKEKSTSLKSIMPCSRSWKEAVPLVLMILPSTGCGSSWMASNWWHSMPSMSATVMDLSPLLRTGIIRLLRKGQKDPTLTGNYRPISLLSIHYKLASCCITQRLRPMVGKVIGQQQKAYVPGNVIGSCIINILNLMKYANRRKLESLILLIDFRKAFDSLSHKYIDECLKKFNFGQSIAANHIATWSARTVRWF